MIVEGNNYRRQRKGNGKVGEKKRRESRERRKT
jgi:hypothetical protein